jgi:single-stranded DNA-binding protein
MNIRIVDGRLTRDAEVRVNKTNNKKFLTFTIANNDFVNGKQTTTYFNIVSYNEFDVNRLETLTKGKLVVVNGKPNEVMTIKDNKTYLNRNIMAHNIEMGTFVKESTSQVTSYSDVAPLPNATQNLSVSAPSPTCEVPRVVAPTVSIPTVSVAIPQTQVASAPSGPYEVQTKSNAPDVMDDLPF